MDRKTREATRNIPQSHISDIMFAVAKVYSAVLIAGGGPVQAEDAAARFIKFMGETTE